jgi:hypothetical protein
MASDGATCRAFDDNLLTVGDNLSVGSSGGGNSITGEHHAKIVATDYW